MRTWRSHATILPLITFVALVGLVGACSGRPAPGQTLPSTRQAPTTPAPSPTFTQWPTAALAPASATPSPSRLPEDWIDFENRSVRLALPPTWQVVEPTSGDAQAALEDLRQNNPQMADIIGTPGALQSAALWAFGPASSEFTDSLNIRGSLLGAERITDMQGQVLDLLLPQLDKAGFAVLSSDANLLINGLPAARITYTLPTTSAGKSTPAIRGHQYLVLSDSHLWILSYSTTREREARMAPIFEQSARSFRPQ